MKYFFILFLFSIYLIFFSFCEAKETLSGPISAHVMRVIDGDTIVVSAKIWLGHKIETLVRIRGIDAPEIKGKCFSEKRLAKEAKAFLEGILSSKEISLFEISNDKYAGRVLARIKTSDYQDIGNLLIEKGFARSYDGKKRGSWCE